MKNSYIFKVKSSLVLMENIDVSTFNLLHCFASFIMDFQVPGGPSCVAYTCMSVFERNVVCSLQRYFASPLCTLQPRFADQCRKYSRYLRLRGDPDQYSWRKSLDYTSDMFNTIRNYTEVK